MTKRLGILGVATVSAAVLLIGIVLDEIFSLGLRPVATIFMSALVVLVSIFLYARKRKAFWIISIFVVILGLFLNIIFGGEDRVIYSARMIDHVWSYCGAASPQFKVCKSIESGNRERAVFIYRDQISDPDTQADVNSAKQKSLCGYRVGKDGDGVCSFSDVEQFSLGGRDHLMYLSNN